MKSGHQQQVEEFMLLARQDVPDKPTEPSGDVRLLRARLIMEEALETIRRGLGVSVHLRFTDDASTPVVNELLKFYAVEEFCMVETIDGCCDLAVVTTGTLSACGVPDLPFQQAVDQNNLEKFGPGNTIRDDGKLIKPPGHKPPDIAGILSRLARGVC